MSGRVMLPGGDDTIVAIATPVGRGALALIRISGANAIEIATHVIPGWQPVDRHASFVELREPQSHALIDRGIATFFRAPRSYTGEDVVELSIHGGHLVPVLVLGALLRAGAREALPGEFTRRAVFAGKMDLLQAEAVGDLIDATSRAMHGVALRQLDGSLSREVIRLRDAILDLEALIAYDIDFPEEDEGAVAAERVTIAVDTVIASLERLLATSDSGEVVREGAVVAIAGEPNVGKSSLFNALVGSTRAIVTEIPGTTRDAIEAVVEIDGWPVRLVDTAGLRETTDVVERLGIEVSERYLASADLVLGVGDTSSAISRVATVLRGRVGAPVLLVRAKSDLPSAIEEKDGSPEPIHVSVVTNEGLGELTTAIAEAVRARYGRWDADVPVLVRQRHRDAVERARDEVAAFRSVWGEGNVPAVVAAVHLRAAVSALEGLIGVVDVEDVLGRVFRTFCVGK